MLYVYKCEITISRRRSREEKKNNKVSTRTNKRASHTIYLTTWQGVRESEQRLDSQGVQTVCPFTTRGLCDDGLPLESRAPAARVTHSVQSQLDKSLKGVDKKMGVTYKILEPGARKAGGDKFWNFR